MKRLVFILKFGLLHKRSSSDIHAKQHPIKYEHKLALQTDGAIKTMVSNVRELYCDLRDSFNANRKSRYFVLNKPGRFLSSVFLTGGFNSILVIAVVTYSITFVERVFLDYKKEKREEKKAEWEHEYKKHELGIKEPSDQQQIQQPIVLETPSIPNKAKNWCRQHFLTTSRKESPIHKIDWSVSRIQICLGTNSSFSNSDFLFKINCALSIASRCHS